MKRVTPVILAASALLLVLDIVGALVRHPLGFPYFPLGIVCLLTYFTVGLVAAWQEGVSVGVAAAAIVGFLDSTLGPLAAWFIGQGSLNQTIEEPGIFAYGITVVTLTAAEPHPWRAGRHSAGTPSCRSRPRGPSALSLKILSGEALLHRQASSSVPLGASS